MYFCDSRCLGYSKLQGIWAAKSDSVARKGAMISALLTIPIGAACVLIGLYMHGLIYRWNCLIIYLQDYSIDCRWHIYRYDGKFYMLFIGNKKILMFDLNLYFKEYNIAVSSMLK